MYLISNLDVSRRTAAPHDSCTVQAASNDRHGPVSHDDPVTAPVISARRIITTVVVSVVAAYVVPLSLGAVVTPLTVRTRQKVTARNV